MGRNIDRMIIRGRIRRQMEEEREVSQVIGRSALDLTQRKENGERDRVEGRGVVEREREVGR